jgi:hypothetical protein
VLAWLKERALGHLTVAVAVIGSVVVLAIFFVFPGILGVGYEASQGVPLWLRNVQAGADVFQKMATGGGVIVGGLFAYFRFFKERTHASNIQPTISYSMAREEDVIYLRVSASATNIGQSKVDINREFSALRVATRKYGEDGWTLQRIEGVLAEQAWIEPNETVGEPIWVEMYKADNVAIRLDLYVAESEKLAWIASEIISLVPESNGNGGGVN